MLVGGDDDVVAQPHGEPATMSLDINLHTLDVSDEQTQTAINHKNYMIKSKSTVSAVAVC